MRMVLMRVGMKWAQLSTHALKSDMSTCMQWAQLSTHAFKSEQELAQDIIYNYATRADPHGHFQEVYVFDHSEQAPQ
jgi:hypothetical protein